MERIDHINIRRDNFNDNYRLHLRRNLRRIFFKFLSDPYPYISGIFLQSADAIREITRGRRRRRAAASRTRRRRLEIVWATGSELVGYPTYHGRRANLFERDLLKPLPSSRRGESNLQGKTWRCTRRRDGPLLSLYFCFTTHM